MLDTLHTAAQFTLLTAHCALLTRESMYSHKHNEVQGEAALPHGWGGDTGGGHGWGAW